MRVAHVGGNEGGPKAKVNVYPLCLTPARFYSLQEQFNTLELAVKLPHLVTTIRSQGAAVEVKYALDIPHTPSLPYPPSPTLPPLPSLPYPPSLPSPPLPSLPLPLLQVKTMAAVLLRRVFLQIEYKEMQEGINEDVLRQCRAELLQAIAEEPVAPVRRKIGDAVAEMARASIGVCACMYIHVCAYVCVCVCVCSVGACICL